jgi:CBS-domain-containing membrane protein
MSVGLVTLLMRGDWLTGLWSMMTGLLLIRLLYSISPEILQSVKESRKKTGRTATVEEVMAKSVDSALPEMFVSEFLESVANSLDKIAFPVIKERRLHGMLKASDAKNLSSDRQARTCVRELMEPVTGDHFVSSDLPIDEAARRLKSNGLGHAAVLDGEGFVVGYLSLADLNHKEHEV